MKLSEVESRLPSSFAPSQRVNDSGRQTAHRSSRQDAATPRSAPAAGGWFAMLIGFTGLLASLLVGAHWLGFFDRGGGTQQSPTAGAIPSVYDAERSMRYLNQVCDIGTRVSGSDGMRAQQELLQGFFAGQGGEVSTQSFQIRHPEDGSLVSMANLIARWNVDRPKRFLLCAHYDTRPFPDRDRRNRRGTFIGANDGGSGTAALMEFSHHVTDLPDDVGVDLVLFDGEEFVWEQGRDEYFLGSKFFARNYVAQPPEIPYRAGILFDMVADRELRIYYEHNSLKYAPDVARGIWKTADRLGVRAFVPRARHRIDDDHIPLNQIARIPTVDLIDFDYPRAGIGAPSYWHTEQDVPENCSGHSIAAVVWVVHEWLKQQ